MGLSSPFFDNKPDDKSKENLLKMKWDDNDSLSEMMVEYMIDFGNEIKLTKIESLHNIFNYFFKTNGFALRM